MDPPHCERGHPSGAVEHLLLECVRYTSERTVLRRRLAVLGSRPFPLSSVLDPWQTVHLQWRAVITIQNFFLQQRALYLLTIFYRPSTPRYEVVGDVFRVPMFPYIYLSSIKEENDPGSKQNLHRICTPASIS